MQQKTHIANVLERNNCKDRYDTQVKHILSDKTVLSWILKYTTSEFKDYPIELIKSCIEGEPEVGTHRVFPSLVPEDSDTANPMLEISDTSFVINSDATDTASVPEAITGIDTVDSNIHFTECCRSKCASI